MADNPPYLSTPGTLSKALEKIKSAATPERFTTDFVNTVLGFKGGTGAALIPFFKRIGFVKSDGTPSELYSQFRNPSLAKRAAAQAMRIGYRSLYERNEYVHKANDQDLKGVVVEVTGGEPDSQVVRLILSTFKSLKSFCDFEAAPESAPSASKVDEGAKASSTNGLPANAGLGLNLAYSINLHLPASDDVRVYDAIFKSLKEHLLRE